MVNDSMTAADTLTGVASIEDAVRALGSLHGSLMVGAADPFVQAAMLVLRQECGLKTELGKAGRQRSSITPGDWNAAVAVMGPSVAGLVLYSTSRRTALRIASKMVGEELPSLNRTATSALNEMANMITGRASMHLEDNGFPSQISPPRLLPGSGSFITSRPITWMDLPLHSEFGQLEVWLALRQA